MTQADWFEAMQKHMTDGAFFSVQMGLATKVNEVAKYISMVDLGVNTGPMCVMNLERWNKLPNDVKQVFEQVMKEMPAKGKQLTIDYEAASIKEAGTMGITLVPFPERQKWIDSLPDIRAPVEGRYGQKGLGPGGGGSHQTLGPGHRPGSQEVIKLCGNPRSAFSNHSDSADPFF